MSLPPSRGGTVVPPSNFQFETTKNPVNTAARPQNTSRTHTHTHAHTHTRTNTISRALTRPPSQGETPCNPQSPRRRVYDTAAQGDSGCRRPSRAAAFSCGGSCRPHPPQNITHCATTRWLRVVRRVTTLQPATHPRKITHCATTRWLRVVRRAQIAALQPATHPRKITHYATTRWLRIVRRATALQPAPEPRGSRLLCAPARLATLVPVGALRPRARPCRCVGRVPKGHPSPAALVRRAPPY